MQPTPLPEYIEGNQIILKKHEIALAQTMIDYVNEDRHRLKVFLPWVESTKTIEDEIKFIQVTHDAWDRFKMFDFGIFEKTSKTYLGNIGVHTISWTHEWCELGYWILGKFEGRGFISDAVTTLERELFKIGFNRIEIRCDPNNKKSASVPLRNGYTCEGILKSHMKMPGDKPEFRDTQIFAKINQK